MPNKLHRQVKGLSKEKSDKLNLISGSLGITIGGQKTVEVPNRDGYVFVKLRGSQSELIQAYNASVSPIYDLPVLLTRQGNHYAVYGRDLEQYNNWGNTPYLPKHGTQHSFAPELGLGGDVTWIYSRQFVPMLAMPSGSAGAASLVINPYIYRNPSDGSFEYVGNIGTASFLPAKPSNNQARLMLLYWDLNLDTTGMITGSLFDATITGTAQITPYIPSISDSQKIPLAAVRLVSGTTTLDWENIYDIRQFAVNTSPPFNGGFGVWDEGISQGTGTILNFVGAGVVASVSGTVVNVNIAGGSASPPITGSVVIQDEGVIKGSALTLNFVGANIDASISGSVARIFVTGSVGGGSVAADMWTSGSVGVGIRPSSVSGGNDAVGNHSLAHGNGALAVGQASHAEGTGTLASGTSSHADGSGSQAYGSASYAGGSGNKAVGSSSFVTGEGNIASGTASFISGVSNKAMSPNSATLGGAGNLVTGERSVILGGQNITGSASDTAYMNLVNIRVLNSGTSISNIGIDSQGFLVSGTAGAQGAQGATGMTGRPGGASVVLFDHYVDAGNGTTVETDLYSDTLAAGQLANDGDKIQAEYSGVYVSSATATRQIKLKFAGTTIFDTGALTLSLSSAWELEVLIIRVSATVIRHSISFATQGAALSAYTASGELTGLTLSNTNILKITGQAAGVGAATNDIVAKLATVIFVKLTDPSQLFNDAEGDPADVGTTADGTSTYAARRNHVHSGIPTPGWIAKSETWTRTGNHTFTVAGDLTTTYRKGTLIRYKDGGAYEYGIILSSVFTSLTTINLLPNDNYAMAAATITDTYISYITNPDGFPTAFDWTPTFTGFTATVPIGTHRIYPTKPGLFTIIVRHGTNGISNATTFYMSIPFTASANSTKYTGAAQVVDNSVVPTTSGNMTIVASDTKIVMEKDYGGTGWTAANNKRCASGTVFVEY